MKPGCLILESGEVFHGYLTGEQAQVGEVVFNTSHSGYEEIATDPSYYSQIVVMTAPMQGNYGSSPQAWESDRVWIKGFVTLEIQGGSQDQAWQSTLQKNQVPILSHADTRRIVLRLREKGVVWGAVLPSSPQALAQARSLIKEEKKKQKDWTQYVSVKTSQEIKGEKPSGPRVLLLDFGYKKNILRELQKRCSHILICPASLKMKSTIKKWKPDGLLLSNGPGDPQDVEEGSQLVKELLGWKFMFGICMGNQILGQAVGAKNYRLKFGHRGGNHPIRDHILNRIYMVSQNHGYAIDPESLPKEVEVSHINLNDQTVAGILSKKHSFVGVQFHPENHPGPKESALLFDMFIKSLKSKKNLFLENKTQKRRV